MSTPTPEHETAAETAEGFIFDESSVPDAGGDAERAREAQLTRNYARVGSQRPTSLLYTYGPGAIIDLSHFTVMTSGYRSLERIYQRRAAVGTVQAPRLLATVQRWLPQVRELRTFPWAPKQLFSSTEGDELGVDTIVFPQWLRCTGCDRLATVAAWEYRNDVPRRPERATFLHTGCTGRPARRSGRSARGAQGSRRPTDRPVVTARYLLACTNGHLDEFPYGWWVHEGGRCPTARDAPTLALQDMSTGGNAVVECRSCGASRTMSEARGPQAHGKLPRCRGRHPHLDGFDADCDNPVSLTLVGASNLWFPAVTSAIVMPSEIGEVHERDEAQMVADSFADDPDELAEYLDQPRFLRRALREIISVEGRSEDELLGLAREALTLLSDADAEESAEPETAEADAARTWDPIDLLQPEWEYLQRDPAREREENAESGLTLSPRSRTGAATPHVTRVLAVDKLRKVNALLGFTRIDDFDRVTDPAGRLVALDPSRYGPRWTLATTEQGEGIYLQLDEAAVARWEARVEGSALWAAHLAANRVNVANRYSDTAGDIDPDERMPPPRYWLLHTFAHLLMRRMAMSSGYGGASISERLYAWPATRDRAPAAGVLLCTTASDSDGTLGGLVRLADEDRLPALVQAALTEAGRCSSDPVCALRVPRDGEDFLHGAACHCCTQLPETSCERGNRYLDRRFVVPLPGPYRDLAFTGHG